MFKREFTEEQEMLRQSFRQFLAEEIVPNMEHWRDQGRVDREAFLKAGSNGYLLIWADEEFGGMGDRDFRFQQVIIEELAFARCNDFYATLHSRIVAPYLERFGTQEQKKRFLPRCVSGEIILGVAMTEPDAGSDLAGMRSVAVEYDDYWVLNGSKTYISNGVNGDLFVVAAKTDPENSPHALTLFLVERGMEGFERGRNLKKMGLKAQDTAELFFNDVKVPKENVLGDPGKGFRYLMQGLAEERLISACGNISAAQLSFELTREYVKERRAFGKSVSGFQNTQFTLAEVRTQIDITQMFIDQCVAAHNRGDLKAADAAKAKLAASELNLKTAQAGVQLHGGAGYMDEYPISRQLTDAMIAPIYAGSSEIMKLLISRDFFDEKYVPFCTRNF